MKVVFAAAVDGIYKSIDSGAIWDAGWAYGSSIVDIIEYSGTLYALSINGDLIVSADNGGSWTDLGKHTRTGSTFYCIVHAGNNTILIFKHGSYYRSTDGGSIWTEISSLTSLIPYEDNVCSLGGGVVLAGRDTTSGSNIYRSIDYGATWSTISPPWNTSGGPTTAMKITSIVDCGSGVAVAVGYREYFKMPFGPIETKVHIFRSIDSGQTWLITEYWPNANTFSNAKVTKLDSTQLLTAWYYAYQPNSLWERSSDNGITWSGPMAMTAEAWTIRGVDTNIAVAKFSSVVNRTVDFGTSWTPVLSKNVSSFVSYEILLPPEITVEESISILEYNRVRLYVTTPSFAGVGFSYIRFQADSGFPYEKKILRSYRSYITSLSKVIDPMSCDSTYLPYLARTLGYNLKYEDYGASSLEIMKKRIQVKELLKWYAMKGTNRSFKYIFEVIRGQDLNPELAWVQIYDVSWNPVVEPRSTTVWVPLGVYPEQRGPRNFGVNIFEGILNMSDHHFGTTDPIQFTTTGVLPSPLAVSTTYYVIYHSENEIKVATTKQNSKDGIHIPITDLGTGFHYASLHSVPGYSVDSVKGPNWVPDSRIRLELSSLSLTEEDKNNIISRLSEVKPEHLVFDFTQTYQFIDADADEFELDELESLEHNHMDIVHDETTQDPVLTHRMVEGVDVASFRERTVNHHTDMFPNDPFIEGSTLFGKYIGVA